MEHIETAEPKTIFGPLTRLRQIRRHLKLDLHRLPFRRRWATSKTRLSSEWLAPLIAWLTVLLIGTALVGLLLAEE